MHDPGNQGRSYEGNGGEGNLGQKGLPLGSSSINWYVKRYVDHLKRGSYCLKVLVLLVFVGRAEPYEESACL